MICSGFSPTATTSTNIEDTAEPEAVAEPEVVAELEAVAESEAVAEPEHSTVVEGLEHSIYEPKVIEKPDNQTVAVGMDTHLKCVVDSGSLVPSIHWAKVGEGGNETRPNFTMIPEFRNEEELVLRNVTKKDQGLYVCVCENTFLKTAFNSKPLG